MTDKMTNRFFKNDYQLPKVVALQAFKVAETGANQPLFIKGVDVAARQAGEYVLKYRGAERMDEQACLRELLAAFLADSLGVFVPEPVGVIVQNEFVETLRGWPVFPKIQQSVGLNFGSIYKSGNISVQQHQTFTPDQLQEAAQIFVFDVLVKNPDRNIQKPNLFLADDHFWAIDHELAFGFLVTLPSLLSKDPAELNDTDVNDAKNHFFYPALTRNVRRIDWDEVFNPFEQFQQDFWMQASVAIPTDWHDEATLTCIQARLNPVFQNFQTFRTQIWNKLLNP